MTKHLNFSLLVLGTAIAVAPIGRAADLLNYTFDSLDGTPSYQAAGITGSIFDRDGDHFISYSTLTGNPAPAAISNGWDTSSFSDSFYYTFSVTASGSATWDNIRFDIQGSPSGAGGDAPTNFAIRSSVDGFATDLATGSLTSTFTAEQANQHVVAAPGTTVEYRIYAWGTSSRGATLSVDGVAVSAVPEPASIPLVAVGMAAVAGIRAIHRRSRRVS